MSFIWKLVIFLVILDFTGFDPLNKMPIAKVKGKDFFPILLLNSIFNADGGTRTHYPSVINRVLEPLS